MKALPGVVTLKAVGALVFFPVDVVIVPDVLVVLLAVRDNNKWNQHLDTAVLELIGKHTIQIFVPEKIIMD